MVEHVAAGVAVVFILGVGLYTVLLQAPLWQGRLARRLSFFMLLGFVSLFVMAGCNNVLNEAGYSSAHDTLMSICLILSLLLCPIAMRRVLRKEIAMQERAAERLERARAVLKRRNVSFSELGVCPEELDDLDRILFASGLEDHLLKHSPQDPSRADEAVSNVAEILDPDSEKDDRG